MLRFFQAEKWWTPDKQVDIHSLFLGSSNWISSTVIASIDEEWISIQMLLQLLKYWRKIMNHTSATTTIHFVVNSWCWISADSYRESCCYTGSIAPHKLAIESSQCFSSVRRNTSLRNWKFSVLLSKLSSVWRNISLHNRKFCAVFLKITNRCQMVRCI